MNAAEIIMTAAGTGVTSTALTIAALRVHIQYLRETVTRLEGAIERAHKRIDRIQGQIGAE